jgi:hypothetical protein
MKVRFSAWNIILNVATGTVLLYTAVFAVYGKKSTTYKDEAKLKQAISRKF